MPFSVSHISMIGRPMRTNMLLPDANRTIVGNLERMLVSSFRGGELTFRGERLAKPKVDEIVDADQRG